jgi:hypothetical protein
MRFLILGLPKTGKTMLVNTLNLLPGFKVLGEIMNTRGPNPNMPDHPQKVIQDMRAIDTAHNIHTWFTNKYPDRKKHDITQDLSPNDIDNFMRTIYLKNKHCAFKLHHHHIQLVPYLLEWFLTRPDIKIMHCNRQNKMKQALAAIGNRARGKQFEADPQSTLNLMKDNSERFLELRKWFGHLDNYKEFDYENMTNDTDSNTLDLRPIKEFLQVEMPDSVDILTRKNTKDKISENLTNYDEFVEFFKNGYYNKWID